MKIANGTVFIVAGTEGTRVAGMFGVAHRKRGSKTQLSWEWFAAYEIALVEAKRRQSILRGYRIESKRTFQELTTTPVTPPQQAVDCQNQSPVSPRQPLLDVLKAMPEEAFVWLLLYIAGFAGRQVWPDGLGGFQPESRDTITKAKEEASKLLDAAPAQEK